MLFACADRVAPQRSAGECSYYEVDFGYPVGSSVPAVGAAALAADSQCLPSGVVPVDDAGRAGCTMLVTPMDPGGESLCTSLELEIPSAEVLAAARARDPDAGGRATCVIPQLSGSALDATGSCQRSATPGWCYVTGVAAQGCAETVFVSPAAVVAGAHYSFSCSRGC